MNKIIEKYKTLLALNIPDIKVFAAMTEKEISEFCDIREQQFGIRPSKTYCDLLRISKGASWYNDGVELNLADPENFNIEERWDIGAAFQNAIVIHHLGNGDQFLVDINPDGEPGFVMGWDHETPALSIYCRDLAEFFDICIQNWNHPENTSKDPDIWLEYAIFEPLNALEDPFLGGKNLAVDYETALTSKNPTFRKFAKQVGEQYQFADWSEGKPNSGAFFSRKWFKSPSIRNDDNGLIFAMQKTGRKPSIFDKFGWWVSSKIFPEKT